MKPNSPTDQCLTHIESKRKNDGTATVRCYTNLLSNMLERRHTDNTNGTENWFKETEADRIMARIMASRLRYPYIPYSLIMGVAQGAFHNSNLDLKNTLAIGAGQVLG
jgi:hypothetical protein